VAATAQLLVTGPVCAASAPVGRGIAARRVNAAAR
jgi:hypothetical protein